MRRSLKSMRFAWVLVAWHLLVIAGLPCAAVDAIVVRPAAWSSVLQPWKKHRVAQGYAIAEVDSEIGREAIRATIRDTYRRSNGRLRFVLLAGDVNDDVNATGNIPTFHHASSAMVQFGGDPWIASDNSYGDMNGDQSPELAVGRIPADSAEQLGANLDRIVKHEQQTDFSNWRRRVHVIAGVGGFGPLTDSMIDMTTRRFLADRIPGWSEMSMTQASLHSHYCPDPLQLSDTCIARMNQGGMFWVYIGHGHVHTLDYMQAGAASIPIMTTAHIPSVNSGSRAPIAVFLACYTGAFDAREDSLAEQLVLSPTGPIAAIAASRVSGPYGLAMLSEGLLSSCFDHRAETLGEVMLTAKRGLLDETRFDVPETQGGLDQHQLINAIAQAMSPQDYDLAAERLEHVWQMNLLGDPMLNLSHPRQIEFEAPQVIGSGQMLPVDGFAQVAGKMTIELAMCRGQVSDTVRQTDVGLASDELREHYQTRYAAANHSQIAVVEFECVPGQFSTEIAVPSDLPRGKYCLRLYQEAQTGWRVGYQEIRVRPSEPQQP